MSGLGRRSMMQALGAGTVLSILAEARPARASLVRGLSLADLVRQSRGVSVLRAVDQRSHWEVIGGRRVIVTDSSMEVLDHLAKDAPSARRIRVRTLGGRVGRVGQLVLGQARFAWSVPSVVFVTSRDDVYYVVGMAQGHYPLEGSAAPRLLASPELPEIVERRGSAVERLVGQTLADARALISVHAGTR